MSPVGDGGHEIPADFDLALSIGLAQVVEAVVVAVDKGAELINTPLKAGNALLERALPTVKNAV